MEETVSMCEGIEENQLYQSNYSRKLVSVIDIVPQEGVGEDPIVIYQGYLVAERLAAPRSTFLSMYTRVHLVKEDLTDGDITRIASMSGSAPIIASMIRDDVNIGEIRESVLRFARAILEAQKEKSQE